MVLSSAGLSYLVSSGNGQGDCPVWLATCWLTMARMMSIGVEGCENRVALYVRLCMKVGATQWPSRLDASETSTAVLDSVWTSRAKAAVRGGTTSGWRVHSKSLGISPMYGMTNIATHLR